MPVHRSWVQPECILQQVRATCRAHACRTCRCHDSPGWLHSRMLHGPPRNALLACCCCRLLRACISLQSLSAQASSSSSPAAPPPPAGPPQVPPYLKQGATPSARHTHRHTGTHGSLPRQPVALLQATITRRWHKLSPGCSLRAGPARVDSWARSLLCFAAHQQT